MHILKSLVNLRQQRGLLQKDVAAAIGVDRTTYVKYERGTSEPNFDILARIAEYFDVSVDYLLGRASRPDAPASTGGVWIPVLGAVQAGIPVEAIEDIEDYEEITKEMAAQGEHFALRVRGESMEPKFSEGDVVIVRKQEDIETGDIAVVIVNGDEATIKKIKKGPDGIILIASNHAFEPMYYSNNEIEQKPVRIMGKVVELRAKF